MKTEKKIVGVIGGMGPLATVDLYRKIVEHTAADCDQAHVRTIIDSNTNIPDRTAALLSGGESPVKELQSSARLLASGCSGACHAVQHGALLLRCGASLRRRTDP